MLFSSDEESLLLVFRAGGLLSWRGMLVIAVMRDVRSWRVVGRGGGGGIWVVWFIDGVGGIREI